MLTPTSTFENPSFPSVVATRVQGVPTGERPDRRQEFENMLPQVMPRFRRMAMRSLRNPEDAEDAVQDAMLSAFRHIENFDGRAQMMTWLTTILINAVRMQIRRRPRGQMLSLDQTQEEGQQMISEMLADPSPTPEQTLQQNELSKLVGKLTSSLSAPQQAALRLRLQDDLSIQETAETLGVPAGTVKAQIARSRIKLTERFHAATTKHKIRTSVVGSKIKHGKFSGCGFNSAQDHMPAAVYAAQAGGEVCSGAWR